MAKLLTLKKKAYECHHWPYQEQFQGSAFSKQLTNIWLINFYIKHRMQEEMLQLLSLVASTRTPSFILLGAARSLEFSWFCCCRSDGNTPTQLGGKKRNKSLLTVEKSAQINSADLTLELQKCQAGWAKASSAWMATARRCHQPQDMLPSVLPGDMGTSASAFPKAEMSQKLIRLKQSNMVHGHRMAAETHPSSAAMHSHHAIMDFYYRQ